MSFEACAALVERADPDRFRAIMSSPVSAREVLFPIFAFNVEISRAPWVATEPMIAEMRLQWWRDALTEIAEGAPVRRHEIVDGLVAVLDRDAATELDRAVSARRWECYRDPFEDEAHLEAYLEATSGAVLWTAARLLGASRPEAIRDFGFGAGVAGFLRAVPELEARGRIPLLDGTPDGVRVLAAQGLKRLDRARQARRDVPRSAYPAMLCGWPARSVLRKAVAQPGLVARGALRASPLRLPKLALLGWWR